MSDDLPIQPKPRASAGEVQPPTPPTQEDTGSQALSEALQSSFFLVKLMMVLLVLVFFGSGFFKVDSGQQAIKLRFGKPVGEGENALLGPGAHWAFPAPIDEVRKISLGKRQEASSTIGMPVDARGEPEEPPQPRENLNPAADGYTLTADANIVHARAKISYRVNDPVRYLFDYTDAAKFVTNALDNALIYASSRFTVDEVLKDKLTDYRMCVEKRARELIDAQQLGIVVENLTVTPYPPGRLKDTFEAVSQAHISGRETNAQALSFQMLTLTQAATDAHARTNAAQVAANDYVSSAKVEAKQFCEQLSKFEADPKFYYQWRQAEVLGRILPKVREKMVVSKGKPREVRLQLSREPEEPPQPPSSLP